LQLEIVGVVAEQRICLRLQRAPLRTEIQERQGLPSFTQLAITQLYAPRFFAEVGGPPGVGSSDAAGVGVLRS
jgi:hypothetical protein